MSLRTLGWGTFAVLLVLSAGCDWSVSSQAPTPLSGTPTGATSPSLIPTTAASPAAGDQSEAASPVAPPKT